MNVGELIKILEEYPPDAEIAIAEEFGEHMSDGADPIKVVAWGDSEQEIKGVTLVRNINGT